MIRTEGQCQQGKMLFCSFNFVKYSNLQLNLDNLRWQLQQQRFAFACRLLTDACLTPLARIVDTANRTNATAIGPIHHTTNAEYCLLRPCGQGFARTLRNSHHRRIIDIYQPSSKTIDA